MLPGDARGVASLYGVQIIVDVHGCLAVIYQRMYGGIARFQKYLGFLKCSKKSVVKNVSVEIVALERRR